MTPALRAQVLHEWRPSYGLVDTAGLKSISGTNTLVPSVMKGLGLEQRLQQSQVFYLWPEIVGAENARHAHPVSLRNGQLVVAVDHPMWLQELSRYHKSFILQKVQARIGKKAVRDICFRIG
jgi:predicted nucleic acid-binding Zn ribbon protein